MCPVVVAPKLSGDIRLRVDIWRANEAFIRERLPIPTIDESPNGSGVFSKLDLMWDLTKSSWILSQGISVVLYSATSVSVLV